MKLKTGLSIILISTLIIAGCTVIPVSTIWKMRNLNPLNIDPKDLSIAMVTHKAVKFGKDAVKIHMAYKTSSVSTSFDETLFGQVSSDVSTLSSTDQKQLLHYKTPTKSVNIFSLNDETAQFMQVLQKKIRVLERNKTNGSGDFSIDVKDVCLSNPKINKLPMYLLVKFNQKDGYILLFNGVDLLKQLPRRGITKQAFICK